MFKQLYTLVKLPEPEDENVGVELATAALLMEIVYADYKCEETELQATESALRTSFALDPDALKSVMATAEKLHSESVSIYPFIEAINADFSETAKYKLIRNLWKVALADGELDKFEQHYIRKIAELIYVPHSEFIRAKLEVIKS